MNTKTICAAAALALLAGCAGRQVPTDVPTDRFGLANQSQLYMVHHTAKKSWLIEGASYRAFAGPIAAIVQMNESAKMQQRLDLQDPVPYTKERLAERLRQDLGLKTLTILPDASNLPMLPEELGDEARATAATFKQKYPAGAAIEVVTQHWGMDNYKIKYYASARLIDLEQSKVLLSTNCTWVIFDQVDKKTLPTPTGYDAQGRYDPNAVNAHADAIEERLNANSGALVKASLRQAAEMCADKLVARFVGPGRP